MARTKKNLSVEQKKKRRREQKKESMRRARAKMRQDTVKYEEEKKKDRERYVKNKEDGKVKLICQLTEREKRKVRKEWRKRSKNYRESQKLKKKEIHFVESQTPPTSAEVQEPKPGSSSTPDLIQSLDKSPMYLPDKRGTSRKESGKRIAKQQREKLKRKIKHFEIKIKESERKNAKLRQKLHRLEKQLTGQAESPRKKVKMLLSSSKNVSNVVKKKLLCGELLHSQIKSAYNRSNSLNEKRMLKSVTCGKIFEKYRCQGYFTSLTSRWRTTLSHGKTVRQIKLRKLREDVKIFLEKDESSRLTAGKKETVTRNKHKRQIRLLNDSMKDLHKKFLLDHPHYKHGDITASYQLFCKLRPFWILPPNVKSRQTCICKLHANISLMVKAMKALKIIHQSTPQDVLKDMCCEIMKEECLERRCQECKQKIVKPMDYEPHDKVKYEQWQLKKVDITVKGNIKKCHKMVKEIIECSKQELFRTFLKAIPIFMHHVNNVKHQIQTIDDIKKHLKQGEALLHIDFSENFNCKYAEEVQSTHFGSSKKQLSLHTSVLYYYRQSDNKTYTACFCTVSENLRHDPSAICVHLKPVYFELKKLEPNLKTIHILSDGPTTQYRNKKMFHLLGTIIAEEIGAERCIWHFSEKGHGKGAPDGVGGTLKRTADNLVARGHDITGQDVFVSLMKEKCPGIKVIGLDKNEAENEMKKIDDYLDQKDLPTFAGTMQVHQIIWSNDAPLNGQNLEARRLSCIHCKPEEKCIHYSLGQILLHSQVLNRISGKKLQVHEVFADSEEENNLSDSDINEVQENDYVIVCYDGEKNFKKHYIGKIKSSYKQECYINFLRRSGNKIFRFPDQPDEEMVDKKNIVKLLQIPKMNTRGCYVFQDDFTSFSNLE